MQHQNNKHCAYDFLFGNCAGSTAPILSLIMKDVIDFKVWPRKGLCERKGYKNIIIL